MSHRAQDAIVQEAKRQVNAGELPVDLSLRSAALRLAAACDGETSSFSRDILTVVEHALEASPSEKNEQPPSELQVQAGAVILATTPLIDAPKLSHNEWMGLSRAILEAAHAAKR